MPDGFILTLSCPDRPGIVHAVSGFLLEHGGNIIEAAQYDDRDTGLFFMRTHFEAGANESAESLAQSFAPIGERFAMRWRFFDATRPPPTLILVSRLGHCLNDLLFRHRSGLLPIDIRAVVSNHRDFYRLAASYDIPFHHIPVTAATKERAEARLMEVVDAEGIELIVLARYMQVLSEDVCRRLEGRAINIHHSFLPSFKGARPYRQAHERGVKLIGATAHFVTGDLDEGPIVEQAVERVDHRASVDDMIRIGRDIEAQVLARAINALGERRVFLNDGKTVVFR